MLRSFRRLIARSSLSHQLRLLGIVALAVCFFGYYLIFSRNFDEYDSVIREKTIQEIERSIGGELSKILKSLQYEAFLIGQYPVVAAAVGSGDHSTIADVLASYGLSANFTFTEILGHKGNFLAGVPNGTAIAGESFYQQLIRRFLAQEKSTHVLPTDKEIFLVAIAPIGQPPDNTGWLVVGKSVDAAVLGEFRRGPRVQTSLFSLERKRLATTLEHSHEGSAFELQEADRAIQASLTTEVSLPESRVRFLPFGDASEQPVGYLAVHISLLDYLKQRRQNEKTFLIYSLIFVAVLLPILAFSTTAVVRPFVGRFERLRKVVSRNTLQMAETGANRWHLGKGITKKCAVLFIDIREFTLYCSRIESSRALNELSAYQTLMLAIIHKHGGDVEKFMGDGILVIFDSEKSPRYAADCLETMVAVLTVMNSEEWTRLFDQKLRLAMAAATGEATFGLIGDADRQEMTIIGPPVNVASKLEVHAKFLDVSNLMRHEDLALATEQGFKLEPHRLRKFTNQVRGINGNTELATISSWS